MLIIREEQIQHFIAADEEQLVEIISNTIRALNEDRVAGYYDEKLARIDEQKDIKMVLNDTNFPPGERFYQTFERVSEEGWLEAETLYNNTFWFPAIHNIKNELYGKRRNSRT